MVSVELDRSLLPILAETMAAHPNVEIVPGDVMRLDLSALIAEKFQGLRPIVCANLPYNITTPVLTKFVETPAIETVTVLIQKEVAQRLAAPQGSADGGAFSLYLQYYMETSCLFDVPREKFLPSPKVTSAVLRCVRREKPAVEVADEAFFFKVIKGAFLLRRKTLVQLPGRRPARYGKSRHRRRHRRLRPAPRRPGRGTDAGGFCGAEQMRWQKCRKADLFSIVYPMISTNSAPLPQGS